MRRWLIGFWFCLAGLLCLPLAAGAEEGGPQALPALTGRVVDLTATLTAPQAAQLEDGLKRIESAKGAQLAILLLPSVKPESIEQFGIRLADAWKLGRKGVDDGLIIIVAKNDRRMRIEVGYGLEGVVPDAVAKRIVSEEMAPRFKQGDYFGGLAQAVAALDGVIAAEGPGVPSKTETGGDGGMLERWGVDPLTLIFVLLMAAAVLHAVLGFFGYLVVSGIAGVLIYLATASLLFGLGAAVAVFVLALFGVGRGGPGAWVSGSGWGGHSGGGFSGGGGGFGGGGASGDW
ncbi:hypothetical protein DLREEDagrD3_24150 [Denitratisoma sp. agr-D3]